MIIIYDLNKDDSLYPYKYAVEVDRLIDYETMKSFYCDLGIAPEHKFVLHGTGIPREGEEPIRPRSEVRFRSEELALAFYSRFGKDRI